MDAGPRVEFMLDACHATAACVQLWTILPQSRTSIVRACAKTSRRDAPKLRNTRSKNHV